MYKGKALLYTDAFGSQVFPCIVPQALQLHNFVKSNSKTILGELVSDPLANQFTKMVSLLADHLMTGLGLAAVKPEQFN